MGFKGWSSKSQFGGGKRRGLLKATVTKQNEYSLSDVAAMGISVSHTEDELRFVISGRFISLNFFKSRTWKEIKTMEDAIEDRIRNCLLSEFGPTLPIRFDSFTVDLRYRSLMDPDNTITVVKIFTDAIVDQYIKDREGNKILADGVPKIAWKGLFFDDDKKFNMGITGLIPDFDLPNDTYVLTYKRSVGNGRKIKKETYDRMAQITGEYDRRTGKS